MLLVVSVFAQRDQLPGEITWGNEIREERKGKVVATLVVVQNLKR